VSEQDSSHLKIRISCLCALLNQIVEASFALSELNSVQVHPGLRLLSANLRQDSFSGRQSVGNKQALTG
jgi:hypothetical protein